MRPATKSAVHGTARDTGHTHYNVSPRTRQNPETGTGPVTKNASRSTIQKMSRILLVPLLLFLTTACSLAGATIAPQDAPDGQGGAQVVQGSPVAAISATAPRSATPMATVDHAATIAVLEKQAFDNERMQIGATQTFEALGLEIARITATAVSIYATNDESNRRNNADAQAKRDKIHIANMTQESDRATGTAGAPALLLTQANAESRAKFADANAVGGTVTGLVVSLAVLLLAVGGLMMAWKYQRVEYVTVELDQFPELQKLDRPVIQTGENSFDTDTSPPGSLDKFRAYAEYALSGGALGLNSVVKRGIYRSYPEYEDVLRWMRKKKYTTEINGKIGLSDLGKKDLNLWRYDFPSPTA